ILYAAISLEPRRERRSRVPEKSTAHANVTRNGPVHAEFHRSLTTTVKFTECVIEPIVAVTVTVYVAGVVSSEVETVSVDVAVPLAVSVTLLGLTATVGHTRTRSDEEIEALTLPAPERPFRLVSVIVDTTDPETVTVRELGEAPMLKSPGGGGGVNLHAANGWSSQ